MAAIPVLKCPATSPVLSVSPTFGEVVVAARVVEFFEQAPEVKAVLVTAQASHRRSSVQPRGVVVTVQTS